MCPYDNIIASFCIDYICLKVMVLARFSTKTAYLNFKNRNAFCKNIEILSFYRKCELIICNFFLPHAF